jgi:tripartite-type tricarboxylate transporter receptor subunit TctC
MLNRRQFLLSSAAAAAAGALPAARAQAVLPLARILVGFPPGGTADVIARGLAEKLRGGYAAKVIVENRPGARAATVMQALMAADPDGATLYLAPHSMTTLYPHVYRTLPFDPLTDVIPVSIVATFEFALSVANNVPARTVPEFIKWCKANPKLAAYGSLGNGTTAHFLGFMLSQASGIDWNHVPYKGAGPGVQDLLGGQIPSLIGPLGDIAPHHRAGKVRVLATSGQQRSPFLPDVPTFEEAGYKGVLATERFGIFLRKGTSPAVVTRLNRDVVNALRQEDFRGTLEKLSYNPRSSSAQEFDAIIKSEYARWGAIVKASGFSED